MKARQNIFISASILTMQFLFALITSFGILISASVAGTRENSEALFRSTSFWVPINHSSEFIAYADPFSVTKIDDYTFDINLTFINNNNEYLPDDTFTYRINCNKNKFRKIGWRINGSLREFNHWLWKVPEAPEEKIPAASIIATAKDVVCGISPFGERMGFLTSYWENNQPRGALAQIWLGGAHIDVAEGNPYLRRAKLAVRLVNSTQFRYEDVFVMCDRREMMFLPEGGGASQWSAISPTAPLNAGLTKLCSDTPSVGQLRQIPLTAPATQAVEPITPTNSPSQSADSDLESAIKEAKKKCAELGFVSGTPKFGDCVLKISR